MNIVALQTTEYSNKMALLLGTIQFHPRSHRYHTAIVYSNPLVYQDLVHRKAVPMAIWCCQAPHAFEHGDMLTLGYA